MAVIIFESDSPPVMLDSLGFPFISFPLQQRERQGRRQRSGAGGEGTLAAVLVDE
jgi:hypothetical protein